MAKYLELRPYEVTGAIEEGDTVYCLDRETARNFELNCCTIENAMKIINQAQAAKREYSYSGRGEWTTQYSFWTVKAEEAALTEEEAVDDTV